MNTDTFYRIGDLYTTSKSGITGRIKEIISVRPNLTKLSIVTKDNQHLWAMVKVGN